MRAFRTPRSLPPGAIRSAYLSLFSKLLADLLPVKEIVGIQPPHVTLVLRRKRIVPNTHDVRIASVNFDREIAEALSGRDEGTALLATHHCSLPFCNAAYRAVLLILSRVAASRTFKPVAIYSILTRPLQLVGSDNRLAPALSPASNSGQPGPGALADQVTLKLAQRTKHMENE